MTAHRRTRVAVLLTGSILALAGCGDDGDSVADDPADPVSASTPAAETTAAGPSPTAPSSEAAAETVAVPVYFVGDTPQGPRLFREFRAVEADNPLQEAVALALAGDSLDPDYRTAFPSGTSLDVSFDGTGDAGSFSVALPDDSLVGPGEGTNVDDARLATQQLVYTLQGVAQASAPVVVTRDGQPTTLLGLGGPEGLTAAPELDVLALVNLTTPEEGAAVSGTFTAQGRASSFEATVPWEVRDASGAVVLEGFATAEGWMERLFPFTTEVDVSSLAPGTYTFAALTDDPSGGEGPGPTEDTRSITVG